jgi:hypothetical protein
MTNLHTGINNMNDDYYNYGACAVILLGILLIALAFI